MENILIFLLFIIQKETMNILFFLFTALSSQFVMAKLDDSKGNLRQN